ncbi:MAG: NAD+ synthase [Thiobacillus sp.]
MKLGIAQLNVTVGDIVGNSALLLQAARDAYSAGAVLLLTPEMSICGYPAEDLVLRQDFCDACAHALDQLALAAPPEIALIVGFPERSAQGLFNSAALIREGQVELVYRKHHLPNHSVFDEKRIFSSGGAATVFDCAGVRFGLNICGDIWDPGPATLAAQGGAQCLLVPNASPYHMNKQALRYRAAKARVDETRVPLVYANMVGGQDELVFDGASFAMDHNGQVVAQYPAWQTGMYYLNIDANGAIAGPRHTLLDSEADVYAALTLAVRDYVTKNGFKGVHLGLSGGIDSALTMAIAVDALGADKVHAVMMPSEFTADISLIDARDMVQRLNVRYSEIAIKPIFDAFVTQLAEEFAGLANDTTEENLQARTRGTLLMALSNKFGSLVLTTGNKSEMATGYATLYGDMAGGFAVLKDVPKTLVYRLANYRNSLSAVIPLRIIDRPPSAELRADQTDQDSLPPYDVLDAILAAYVERDLSFHEIVAQGFRDETVRQVIRLVDRAEYKRRQAPPGPRITARNFGKDRRYPITSKYRPEGVLQ